MHLTKIVKINEEYKFYKNPMGTKIVNDILLKKVRRNLRKIYPLNTPYCAEAFHREYYKKDSSTVQMFEAIMTVKAKGSKNKYEYQNQYDIETINSFYRADYDFYFNEFMFNQQFHSDIYIPREKTKFSK